MDLQTRSQSNGNAGATQRPPSATTRITSASAEHSAQRVPPPKRRWATRLLLPLVILLATLALIAYAARDYLLPATEVEVVRATALANARSGESGEGEGAASAAAPAGPGAVVAQAPGWVEPDPYPIFVSALADGVVEEVLVLEGETVEAGQPVVNLVDEDAALMLDQARAELARREAHLAAARTNFDEPVTLIRAAAVARAQLAGAEASLTRLDAEVAKEQAKLAELEAAYDRLAAMSEQSVSSLQVDNAKYQAQSQRAVVEATQQRRPELEAMVASRRAELTAAERDLELKTDLRRIRDEAEASVEDARVRVQEAELRLNRMVLNSPAAGVVMTRLVAPGDKLMLGGDGAHTAHAIHLYDPSALQVRVDVPLADAAAVGLGQPATIIFDVLPDTEFKGVVTRLVHQADIAKNTVQFKVAITDPSPLLKPDMLARVKFYAMSGGAEPTGSPAGSAASATGPVALLQTAIVDGDDGPFAWWVSPTSSTLEKRPLELGQERGDGLITVRNGLNPGDVLVNNPDPTLEAGQRVRIRDAAN